MAPHENESDSVASVRSGPLDRGPVALRLHWLIYGRNSKQRRDALGNPIGVSLELQEQMSREAIMRIDSAPAGIEVILDRGRSGGRERSRPGRDLALAGVREGRFGAVMAYKASRIGRDLKEANDFWEECQAAGAAIYTCENYDLNDVIIRALIFSFAQREWEDRREWSLKANTVRRDVHKNPPSSHCPAYGLKWQGEKLVRRRDEFAWVERMFRWYDDGWSMGEIARELTRRGVPRRDVGHGQWDTSSVSQKLRSKWYIGLVPDGKDQTWDAGRQFIDLELWKRVNDELSAIKQQPRRRNHVLSGVLFCGCCNGWSPLTVQYSEYVLADGTKCESRRYRCAHRTRDRSFCPGNAILAVPTEAYLLAQVRELIGGDDDIARARVARDQRQSAAAYGERVDDIDRLCAALVNEERQLYNDWRKKGLLTEDAYRLEKQLLDVRRDELERERNELGRLAGLAAQGARRIVDSLLGKGPLTDERWYSLPPVRRNEFLRMLFPYGLVVEAEELDMGKADVHLRLRPRLPAEADRAEAWHHGRWDPERQLTLVPTATEDA